MYLLQVFPSWFRRHLRHRLLCFTISYLWSTVDFWNTGQAESKRFAKQPTGQISSLDISLCMEWLSDWLRWFWNQRSSVSLRVFLLTQDCKFPSLFNQSISLRTFCFLSMHCISRPKSMLSFGSNLGKSWDITKGASEALVTVQPFCSKLLTNQEF